MQRCSPAVILSSDVHVFSQGLSCFFHMVQCEKDLMTLDCYTLVTEAVFGFKVLMKQLLICDLIL